MEEEGGLVRVTSQLPVLPQEEATVSGLPGLRSLAVGAGPSTSRVPGHRTHRIPVYCRGGQVPLGASESVRVTPASARGLFVVLASNQAWPFVGQVLPACWGCPQFNLSLVWGPHLGGLWEPHRVLGVKPLSPHVRQTPSPLCCVKALHVGAPGSIPGTW